MQMRYAWAVLQPFVQGRTIDLDHHEAALRLLQLLRHVGAYTSDAAHDVVPGEPGDFLFHASFLQGNVEVRVDQ